MEKHSQITTLGSSFVFIVSGVFGVLIKYGLHHILSSELEPPFREIPANMVGCFLVGFMTTASSSSSSSVVFGSVTSLALWSQAMASSALSGGWFLALCSLIAGLELAYMSYKIGLDAGLMLSHDSSLGPFDYFSRHLESNHGKITLSVAASLLWLLVTSLAVLDNDRRGLWLACVVAPLGAWIRHQLVITNWEALQHRSFPAGTSLANFASSWFVAAAAALLLHKKTGPAAPIGLVAVAVEALERGFADSMGSISTLMAEAHSFHSRGEAWRAYAYVLSTLLACAALVAAIISTTSLAAVPNIDQFSRQAIFFV